MLSECVLLLLGVVHLTGYLVPEDTNEMDYSGEYGGEMTTSDSEEDEDSEDGKRVTTW